ncbi:DNA-binding transcriptional regulator, GntR family [Nocardioides exalbidus]|uniref:DNA-binding transcriptional regulator, GntR family n=1 Tax=Nocardioides exalbidus TaxID=402596 RepID=A0A1H4QTU9_9ACTN|nr:GntR family transcriptional regulator [Nocardioides exalbidus]SEC23096.1 DNA-binding transcriptional regulator, GntR family [Nocardioides exalbidus]
MGASMPAPLGGEVTYADRSVAVLRAMILDGSLSPGERLNEVHLSQALGISRGPLREALRRLASEGLLDLVPHRGAFVSSFDPVQLAELYQLRIALETHAARLVAELDDRSGVEELARALDDAAALLDEQDSAAYPTDQDFHGTLMRLAANTALREAADSVSARMSLARSRSASQPARARAALAEHRDILVALVEGDADRAASLLRAHLERSLDNAIALLDAGA